MRRTDSYAKPVFLPFLPFYVVKTLFLRFLPSSGLGEFIRTRSEFGSKNPNSTSSNPPDKKRRNVLSGPVAGDELETLDHAA
jgi:hypothetical protein